MGYRLGITPETRRYQDVRCDDCDRALELVGDPLEDGSWSCLQPDQGLELHVVGGYGMFIDLLMEHAPVVVLCRDCAVRACEAFPWLKRAVAPRLHAGVGHECPLAGGLVWEPYWDCECAREERERQERERIAIRDRIAAEHGPHLFLAKTYFNGKEALPSGVCEVCGLSVKDKIHLGP